MALMLKVVSNSRAWVWKPLPKEAIVKDGTQDFILVVEEKEASGNIRFKKVPVTIGAMNDAFVEVKPLEALPKEVQIVLKGAFFVAAQGKVWGRRAWALKKMALTLSRIKVGSPFSEGVLFSLLYSFRGAALFKHSFSLSTFSAS